MEGDISIEVVLDGSFSFDGDPVPLLSDCSLFFLGETLLLENRIVLMFDPWKDVAAKVVEDARKAKA